MITLHRLGHRGQPFQLNPELIATVEANPDTVVSLATGARVVVAETPAQVTHAIRAWRAAILADALHRPEALAAAADDQMDPP
jgi:flagellar protein FlbD